MLQFSDGEELKLLRLINELHCLMNFIMSQDTGLCPSLHG